LGAHSHSSEESTCNTTLATIVQQIAPLLLPQSKQMPTPPPQHIPS
jgi:hypothetical protein